MVIGRTIGLVSSVGKACDLQASLGGFWMVKICGCQLEAGLILPIRKL